MAELKTNAPMAMRYEYYASKFGIHIPSHRQQEEIDGAASTDQGNVSYEIPAIQAVYRIETQGGADNHTPEFAEVTPTQNLN